MIQTFRRLFSLLTPRERVQLLFLAAAVIAMGLFQVAGIGSIMPVVGLLANPDTVQSNTALHWVYTTLGFTTTHSFLFFVGAASLALIILSNAFIALTIWLLTRFSWAVQARLSVELLDGYLAQPYEAFLNRNSADAGKNVLYEVEQLTGGVLQPGLTFAAFGVTALCITGFLIWFNPVIALLAVLVLGGGYVLLFIRVRRTLSRLGGQRIEANTDRFKAVEEAFGGIKETKVLGREDMFVNRLRSPASRFAKSMATQQVLAQIPSYGMQTMAFGSVLAVVLYLMGTGAQLRDVVAVVGIYAFAGYRLLPAVGLVYRNWNAVRFNSVVVDTIYEDLNRYASSDPLPWRERIEVRGTPEDPLPWRERTKVRGTDSVISTEAEPALSLPNGKSRQSDPLPSPASSSFPRTRESIPSISNPLPWRERIEVRGNSNGLHPTNPIDPTNPFEPLPFEHSLILENVTYTYPNAPRPAICDVTLEIPRGAFVGFVGHTGAGKTTLVDIILGLLQPQSGRILVDGLPLYDDLFQSSGLNGSHEPNKPNELRLRAWQRNLGYVPQEIYLTDDTVAANIGFGIPHDELDLAAVERAARIANIHDFIASELPKGYETLVGERGVRLSGGQRQRIGIARALYHDPEVLVLDEATSDLDGATERAVHDAVTNVAAAKTVIMIAHRLTTVQDCDTLFLLHHGSLIANGPYDELLRGEHLFRGMAQVVEV